MDVKISATASIIKNSSIIKKPVFQLMRISTGLSQAQLLNSKAVCWLIHVFSCKDELDTLYDLIGDTKNLKKFE